MNSHRNLRSICHASIGCNDIEQAKQFYQPLLATLDIDMVCDYPHAIAFGKGYPEFWVQIPFDKQPAFAGNGVHFGFVATSKKQVDDFYQTAIKLGGKTNGSPGARPEYGTPYYGCFILDLEENKIEASYWATDD